VFNGIPHY